LAVFVTWWLLDSDRKHPEDDDNFQNNQQANDPVEINDSESILSQIKMSRHKAIAEELSSGLTEEQLQQEKETEKKQLEAIFQLLKEQQDKFNVNSMEELKDQLRLYRR
jgi:CRISPR/Cas system CSM-associated protein Csm2 small subunit